MKKNKEMIQFIQEELVKLHKITLLEETKKKIEKDLSILNEIKKPITPISEKTKAVLEKWILEKGAKKTAVDLVNRLSQTGMVSDLPDTMEYGQGVNKIEALLSKGSLDQAYHSAKSLATRLEKRAMKDMF